MTDDKKNDMPDLSDVTDEQTEAEHDCWKIIKIGKGSEEVIPVRWLYDIGYFRSDEEARGAFRYAWDLTDGLWVGDTDKWMGMTREENHAFLTTRELPRRNLGRCSGCLEIGAGKRMHTPCPHCGFDQRTEHSWFHYR